ncbi:DUF1129 domain-containing protein [Enterococcus asini]|uniref:Integral membrane protein n=3 Tax=Enterococcus asini TaxID=57732 RepID=R2RI42_9ENTE|nr:DUF1129 domain-containing protein [Enterococcus asini]EOH83315.1 hypothetical protein UAS_02438 [Enterococcus asini ATCC 700915]EOT57229.1 hypothetical protein I579_00779 [Enterococcus asini ATCC 700915]MCD5028928.1 DUF1129 domain-containing protein [Enterococcus asini]MDT2743214.1 DUF1129 domain-containing protein [Enterococcus asini]MDT2763959.1 DUF1129 domain-containing protein [Enterococcus asini]
MEPETLRQYVAENRELETQLTKRNEQYIFDLKKSLHAANLSEKELTLVLHEMLPTLVEEQKTGKTARQLFGTVSERTEAILAKPQEAPKDTKPVLMWVDNSLFILGIFGVMVGLMGLFTNGKAQMYGVFSLLVGSALGGFVFYLFYKFFYQYEQPGADKSKRPKLWKAMLLMIPVFFIWMLLWSVTSLPMFDVINPILPPIGTVLIGGAALLLRWYLKKTFNIQGSFTTMTPRDR